MKIQLRKTGANVLFATMITTGIICLYLGSYLTLVRTESQLTRHSHMWNMAIPVAEAGIEEAFSQLYSNNTNLLENNNWELKNDRYFMKTRWLNTNEYYTVGIFNTIPPTIVSEGFTRIIGKTNFISRTIEVETKSNLLFPFGMLADRNVVLNGMNILIDSFDSSDDRYSTAGRYVPAKRKDNGTLVTNSDLKDEFYLGNAKVYGYISTGPGGDYKNRPNLSVGDAAWVDGGNKGVQPGHFKDDVNVALLEIESPITSATLPPGGIVNGITYKYILGDADYQISDPYKFEGGNVLITGKARLSVTADFNFKHVITIQTNASLELYVSAKTATIGGQGIQNNTGVAANFVYYGLPSNESFTFAGNGEFVGCVYAPNAVFTLNGGGQSSGDFAGASVTKSVVMDGQFEFHYDERLSTSGPTSGYMAISWDEITNSWSAIIAGNLTKEQLGD